MIGAFKAVLKRHWPALRLRTILFGTLLFTAALPGVGALFLRVYENTLVRQTEAELIAQGAALAGAAQALWPGVAPGSTDPRPWRAEASTIDLRTTQVLPERPHAVPRTVAPDPEALAMAGRLHPILAQTARTTLASLQLIDRNGVVLIGHEAGGSYARLPEVAAALRGRVRTVLRTNGAYSQVYAFEWLSRASSLRIHHVRPIVVDGHVVGALLLSRSPRALFRGLYDDRGKILLGIGLIFVVLLLLTGLLSRGIARPIEALGEATRGVAKGTGSVPGTPVTAAIEIRALFENFRAMAAAIDRRSRYLRDFAASVSHEFKTPLAGISGAIELFEDHGATMTPTERERFLGNIKADAARLSQLVTRLLDLARADMAQPGPDVAADALAAIRRVADAHDGPGFRVRLDAGAALPLVAVQDSTVEMVLTTLIENARQAGAGEVTIALAQMGGDLAMTVTDNGRGIAPADAERVFEPFFTTRRAAGGTGLGLAIAMSLLRAEHARLTLVPVAQGTRFAVTLPIVQGAGAISKM
ncbi:HAMP domain-containing sensor histidine kinase [Sphingomonas sp. DG1-23]|uniref:sensor histidine kinase n=1 Tax=Sphingomonas sp. DG1-23 TaxID=3068316 RepID=UPI00273DF276|nr:HAMP domain-containing sensor histidine kinase [Sphingomonas sp. DG1-23]MDP5280755.1 HAMP domain-containing sensor histidine kinase [Sphingomonas sp. DG1-23]